MIFGGYNWFQPVGTQPPPKPVPPQPEHYWSCLWTYTAGNQRRQISCSHLHTNEYFADQCAKQTINHIGQYKNGTTKDVQPAVRILAAARNVKYAGTHKEQP